MTFREKWQAAVERNRSFLCCGLDPDPARMGGAPPQRYLRNVIEATADLVCCYKPNLAFFEALGRDGYRVLEETLEAIPEHVPVLGDAKRGDIGNTAEAYARALFDVWGFDAITINAWGGADTVEPFTRRADRGVFIWCRGSNPGARDFQDLAVVTPGGARPLYEVMAEQAQAWNVNGNIGLVAGVTYPQDAARLRQICPEMLLLMPGLGTQGGDTSAVRAAADRRGGGVLVNVSRQVLYAGDGGDAASAARQAADRFRKEINAALD